MSVNDLGGALGSVQARLREFGWALTAWYALHRLLQAARLGLVAPYALVAQPVGAGTFDAVRGDAGTKVRLGMPEDPLQEALPRPPGVNRQRWDAGAECYICTVGDEFAGTIWIARGRYDEDEVRCAYVLDEPARCVWDFDVYVAPRWRAGRTMGRMWKAVDAVLAADGVGWTLSRISRFNPASLRAHARLGAVEIGRATFVVIGRMQLTLGSKGLPWHLSWRAGCRPELHLSAPARLEQS